MKVQHFLLTGIAVAVLSACGSDNNSKTVPAKKIEPAKTVTKAGKVIDPMNRKGAVAFLDTNTNHQHDEGEPLAAVDEASGSYSLEAPEADATKAVMVKVPNGENSHYLLKPILGEVVSCATTYAEHYLWMNGGDITVAADVEAALAKTQDDLDLFNPANEDYIAAAGAASASPEKIREAKSDKLKVQAACLTLSKLTSDATLDSNAEDKEYIHHGAMHQLMSAPGLEAVSEVAKAHAPYVDIMGMEPSSYDDIINSIINFEPGNTQKLIPLTKAMSTAVKGNAAEYFATDGLNTLGVGHPNGEEHAANHSSTHYDVSSEETHLSNYHFTYDHENYFGYFHSTAKPELEKHFVFDTTDREFKKSYHKWEVTDIDLESGDITLVNPWNRFVSRSPVSKVYDVSGVSIDMFLSENPDLKKTWGYLVADDAMFAEGSKINKLTITNNNQIFLLPEVDECRPDDADVKYAILSDDNGEQKLCNYLRKHVGGVKSQALVFDDIFVSEFASEVNPTDSGVDGVIVAMEGSTYIIAQLKESADDDSRGNVKFFKETHVLNEDGEHEEIISYFPTSTPSTWESQKFGTGSNSVDLCRITLPKEVAGFGREVQMHKHAFVVELGEGEDRALRHGKVLEAGLVLPKMPKGLNTVALDSILDNINLEKYKYHEHYEFKLDKKCHLGNSLMKDKFNKVAYAETLKTRDQYHTSAKNCTTYGEDVSTVADFAEREFKLSKHDDDPYRKIKFSAADDNSGTVKIFKDVGSEALYEYEGTYTFHPENTSVKISFIKPEDGKTHHIYLTRVKSIVDADGQVIKVHFKTLHVIEDALKGIVGHHVFLVKELETED
ncbi:hypothetical protein JQC92_07350 [Shewanella sp. 202IG2-18]|uniref:hypothetical protein n=1 Tax=Parashewanella hymeniacidonis TaxID=2807618 RepID=UPI00195FC626|nr:hypothetical protein [Parashewanella hymeniacidonis]MBM7071857.1 hypothetical protein [Parashewanella hymeniacidonis]